jgi:hypothetical protein
MVFQVHSHLKTAISMLKENNLVIKHYTKDKLAARFTKALNTS